MYNYEELPIYFSSDLFEMRFDEQATIGEGLENVTCFFKLKSFDVNNFAPTVSMAISKMIELLKKSPTHQSPGARYPKLCLSVEHESFKLKFNQNNFFIHFNPSDTNIGDLLYRHLYRMQQSGNPITFGEVLHFSLFSFKK